MKRALLASAAAGALVLPVAVLAQSAVTITGFGKVGLENISIGSASGTRANSSEMRMFDNSSRLYFRMTEDLGGGLAAIAQYEMRLNLNTGALSASGNDWVGFESRRWGTAVFGRRDLHWNDLVDDITGPGALDAGAVSIMAYDATGTAFANGSRTANVVYYESPRWGMFGFKAAWSANPIGAGSTAADMGAAGAVNRKGRGWNLAPTLSGKNWLVGYSYWDAKADLGAAPDQRADRLWGYYKWGGFKLGLAWDKSRTYVAATGVKATERNAWSIPVSYSWGPHGVYFHHTVAADDKVLGASTGAKMDAIAYAYALSKRTSVAVTYARINNDSGAAYNFYNSVAGGSADAAVTAGEDPRILQFTVKHSF